MHSRRNARIKVMQLLYAAAVDKELADNELIGHYRSRVDQTSDLFLYTLYIFLKVVRQAEIDAEKRKKKLRPSEIDKKFQPHLNNNSIIIGIEENREARDRFEYFSTRMPVDEDIISQIYRRFAKDASYLAYSNLEAPTLEQHREKLLDCYREVKKDQNFKDLQFDNFANYIDDKSLIIGAMKNTIKTDHSKLDFMEVVQDDSGNPVEFGLELLMATQDVDEDLTKRIEPMLKNWEMERVAVLDSILLQMAGAEMMRFESIPISATMNEYIEIAKLYSSEKSKEFINGVLENLKDELLQENLIVKQH